MAAMNKSQWVSAYEEREWEGYVRQIRNINPDLTPEKLRELFYPTYTYGVGVGMQIEKDLAHVPLRSSDPMDLVDVMS